MFIKSWGNKILSVSLTDNVYEWKNRAQLWSRQVQIESSTPQLSQKKNKKKHWNALP